MWPGFIDIFDGFSRFTDIFRRIKLKPCLWWILAKKQLFLELETKSQKKNTTKMTIIFRETTRGFTKTDFRYLETTWGITIIWLFSNLPYDIALWRAILATFEDENFEVRKILSNFKFIICKKWSFDVTKGGIFSKKSQIKN